MKRKSILAMLLTILITFSCITAVAETEEQYAPNSFIACDSKTAYMLERESGLYYRYDGASDTWTQWAIPDDFYTKSHKATLNNQSCDIIANSKERSAYINGEKDEEASKIVERFWQGLKSEFHNFENIAKLIILSDTKQIEIWIGEHRITTIYAGYTDENSNPELSVQDVEWCAEAIEKRKLYDRFAHYYYYKTGKKYTETVKPELYGSYGKYIIFHCYGSDILEDMELEKAVDGYCITMPNPSAIYDLGIYAYNYENHKLYQLEEALDKQLLSMSDIARLIPGAKALSLGDLTHDDKVTMIDVVTLQRALVSTERWFSECSEHCADVDKSGDINMYDVVLIQRIIAKL